LVVDWLRIVHLRCIRSADLRLAPGLVWVSGANGAGKTTLLEAVYLLDRGRTFRGRRSGPVTTRGEAATAVAGAIRDGERIRQYRWSSKTGKSDGPGPACSRFVGSSSFSIVDGDPALRRRFLDWSLFHVEPEARVQWARLQRLQRQRNAWLAAGGNGRAVWDAPYVEALAGVWARRTAFAARVDAAFRALTTDLLPVGELSIGWRWTGQDRDLPTLLETQRPGDIERGHTFLSPSRGDLVFRKNGTPWSGSRGENKLAGMLLQLAIQGIVTESAGLRQVVLLDDPHAEVSAGYVIPVIQAWVRAAQQVIVTSLERASPELATAFDPVMFHVEQGEFSSN
jgi:DNA replication and repair protein RecF